MWLNGIKRLASRLGRTRPEPTTPDDTARDTAYDSELDTTWHGDHWQNLLASPLDARHYVMEDWAYTPPPAPETTDAPSPNRRWRRWYEQ